MARFTEPTRLIGATDFSGDGEVNDPVWLIKTVKKTGSLCWHPLKRATDAFDANWGRGREDGEWALVYLAFVVSRIPDIQPWHDQTSEHLWHEAGFDSKPPYSRVWGRFTELEQIADVFREAAGCLIRQARKHEPRIGAHVHVDSTEAETHAALVHVEDCCDEAKQAARSRWRRAKARRPQREATSTVREKRQEAVEEPVDERPRPVVGDVKVKVKARPGRKLFQIDGHWYESTDTTAGIRAYTGPRGAIKFWHGYYNQKVVDLFTGGVLAVDDFNASVQEYHCYPDLYAELEENLGDDPESMIADRGFSVRTVFEHNTYRGVATVSPWRKAGTNAKRHDHESHDRHGVPRCKHCGAETRFVRFSSAGSSPRIWFHCTREITTGCKKDQSISCAKDWRLLIPLWRTDLLYHQLQQAHEHSERAHDDWRQRYRVAGDKRSLRPKRRGIAWQRLRSQGALCVEWLRICHREGWLKSAQTSRSYVAGIGKLGQKARAGLLGYRKRIGLTIPYGPAAAALGLGEEEPPSRRPPPDNKASP